MSDLAHAGRFAAYVVWAYAISGGVLLAVTVWSLARATAWKRRAAKAQAARGRAPDARA